MIVPGTTANFKKNALGWVTLLGGSVLVSIWTVIRSISNGVNFDVVGQIGVADQWSHGLHTGTQLGATNYLLKLPLYFVVNSLGFLSPHAKLLLLALICNIATFLLIVLLSERILRTLAIKPTAWLYLALLWLASISGRVYWLEYANSRNLETVGGLLIFYLALRLLARLTLWRVMILVAIGGLVFFADQLQCYTIGGGLLLYALIGLSRRDRSGIRQRLWLIGSLAMAFVLAKLLAVLATHVLPVSFLLAPVPEHSSLFSAHGLATTLGNLLQSTLRVFDSSFYLGGSLANRLRQVLNAGILVFIVGTGWLAWHQRHKHGRLVFLSMCCILTAYGSYAVSGQALQPGTERYLLMVPMLLVLIFSATAPQLSFKRMRLLPFGWLAVLAVSGLLAVGALVTNWPQRYDKDQRIDSMVQYLQRNHYSYARSSRDGIVASYFSDQKITVAPYICQPDHRLIASNLFYDQAGFDKLRHYSGIVPLIVPTGGIISSGTVCDLPAIMRQFGQPLAIQTVPGVGVGLLYNNRDE